MKFILSVVSVDMDGFVDFQIMLVVIQFVQIDCFDCFYESCIVVVYNWYFWFVNFDNKVIDIYVEKGGYDMFNG